MEADRLFLLGVPEDDLAWNFEYMKIIQHSLLESKRGHFDRFDGRNLDVEMTVHLESFLDRNKVHCFEEVGMVGMATSEFGYIFHNSPLTLASVCIYSCFMCCAKFDSVRVS